jgi:MFS family permease
MLVGALFWGISADIIGRKWAFNISLFIFSTATIIAGGLPNWPSLSFFIALVGFGGGGNLILDTTVFLEYLPGNKQWVIISLAAWWGFGQAIAGFIAWGFMGEFNPLHRAYTSSADQISVPERWNCTAVDTCTRSNSMGWQLCHVHRRRL